MNAQRWLAALLFTLAGGLALNSLLGPFVFEVIEYHYSETIRNQGIGLDAVSLLIVAPLAVFAGGLVLRGRAAGSVLGLGPAAYAMYMMPQYIIGPDYLGLPGNNENFFALHFGLFVAAAATFGLAWTAIRPAELPQFGQGRRRGAVAFLLLFPVFLVFALYLPGFSDALSAAPERREYLDNPTAFWIVAFLDLAVAAPAAVASGVALLRGTGWAAKGVYGMVGWFALTPPSVAAMAFVMVVNDDPNASTGRAFAFVAFAVVFGVFAAWLYAPLVGGRVRATAGGEGQTVARGGYADAGRPTPR